MGKEKRKNVSDQFRKQQHKLEIKRNKQQRKQNKEIKEIRNDITKVREELEKLEKLEREGCLDNALRPKKMRLATYYGKLLTAQEKEAVKASFHNDDDDDSSDDDDNDDDINEIPLPPPPPSQLKDIPPPPPPPPLQSQYYQQNQFQPQSVVMPYGTFNESAFPSYTDYLKYQMNRLSYQKRVQEQQEAYQKEVEERKRKEERERAEKEAEEAAAAAATAAMLEDVRFMPMALRVKRQQSLAEKRKAYANESGNDISAKKQKVVVQSSVLMSNGSCEKSKDEKDEMINGNKIVNENDDNDGEEKDDNKNDDGDDDAFADFMNDMKELGAF